MRSGQPTLHFGTASGVLGLIRGYLCQPCNLLEGMPYAPGVFVLYRERPPTTILNTAIVYRADGREPDAGERALRHAFEELARSPREQWSSLALALERVGLTGPEWAERCENRERLAARPTAHLPTETDPPLELCSRAPWRPVRHARARRLCVACHAIDPDRALAIVGDGFGPEPEDSMREVVEVANRFRVTPVPLPPMI